MRLRTRFSLRAALMMMTVVAIAAWYSQKPVFQKVRIQADPNYKYYANYDGLAVWQSKLPERSETRSLRRADFWNLTQDGITVVRDDHGNLVQRQLWRQGKLTGTDHFFYHTDGKTLLSEGRTRAGRPHGVWTWWTDAQTNCDPRDWQVFDESDAQKPKNLLRDATIQSRDGNRIEIAWNAWQTAKLNLDEMKLDAADADRLIEQARRKRALAKPGRSVLHTFEFEAGAMVKVDGKKIPQFTYRIPDQGGIAEMMHAITGACIKKYDLGTRHGRANAPWCVLFPEFEIQYRQAAEARAEYISYVGVPLPHTVALHQIVAENGSAIDCRYGLLHIVPRLEAENWKDTTRLDALDRMPHAYRNAFEVKYRMRLLATSAFRAPVTVALADVIKGIETTVQGFGNSRTAANISIQCESDCEHLRVSNLDRLDSLSVRNVLGNLMIDHSLRCRIEGGSKMKIERIASED